MRNLMLPLLLLWLMTRERRLVNTLERMRKLMPTWQRILRMRRKSIFP